MTEHIDKGLPVLVKTNKDEVPGWKSDVGTYCLAVGYADGGETLLLIVDNSPLLIRYDMSGKTAKNATPVGTWPLPAGTYDPGLDGFGISDGTQLIGLFDRNYRKIAVPSMVKGLTQASSIESLTVGTYFVLNAASGFNYVLIPDSDTMPEMESIAVDLIFIGEKRREVTLESLYVNALNKMAYWLTLPERNGMFFGAAAYRAWADDIESGRYEDPRYDNKNKRWEDYSVYIVNLATSGGLPSFLIKKLIDMNSAYSDWAPLYDALNPLLNNNDVELWPKLQRLGADMDDPIDALRDKTRQTEIAALLRDYASRLDRAVALLRTGLVYTEVRK